MGRTRRKGVAMSPARLAALEPLLGAGPRPKNPRPRPPAGNVGRDRSKRPRLLSRAAFPRGEQIRSPTSPVRGAPSASPPAVHPRASALMRSGFGTESPDSGRGGTPGAAPAGVESEDRIRVEIMFHERRIERLRDALRDVVSEAHRDLDVGVQFRESFESAPPPGSGVAVQRFEVGSTDGASSAYVYERVLQSWGDRLDPHYLVIDASVACDRVVVTDHAALMLDSASRSAVALPANFCGARFTFEGNAPFPVTHVGERRGDLWFGSPDTLFVILSAPMTVLQLRVRDLPAEWHEAPGDTARHAVLCAFIKGNRATLWQPACTIVTKYGGGGGGGDSK